MQSISVANGLPGGALIEHVTQTADHVDIHLAGGLCGIGLYWLERLRDAAEYWYGRAVRMFDPDRWPTGYGFQPAEGPRREVLRLLDGVIGVALSLLAATSSVDPAWDRLLAESFPEA